jgi:hypothetical protein
VAVADSHHSDLAKNPISMFAKEIIIRNNLFCTKPVRHDVFKGSKKKIDKLPTEFCDAFR